MGECLSKGPGEFSTYFNSIYGEKFGNLPGKIK
jgi:hypothetical protein